MKTIIPSEKLAALANACKSLGERKVSIVAGATIIEFEFLPEDERKLRDFLSKPRPDDRADKN